MEQTAAETLPEGFGYEWTAMTYQEIQAQWYQRDYWTELQQQIPEIDAKIEEFNAKVGLM